MNKVRSRALEPSNKNKNIPTIIAPAAAIDCENSPNFKKGGKNCKSYLIISIAIDFSL